LSACFQIDLRDGTDSLFLAQDPSIDEMSAVG
jgi:hypothetical protein